MEVYQPRKTAFFKTVSGILLINWAAKRHLIFAKFRHFCCRLTGQQGTELRCLVRKRGWRWVVGWLLGLAWLGWLVGWVGWLGWLLVGWLAWLGLVGWLVGWWIHKTICFWQSRIFSFQNLVMDWGFICAQHKGQCALNKINCPQHLWGWRGKLNVEEQTTRRFFLQNSLPFSNWMYDTFVNNQQKHHVTGHSSARIFQSDIHPPGCFKPDSIFPPKKSATNSCLVTGVIFSNQPKPTHYWREISSNLA